MISKKFIPCIYLYHTNAVENLTDLTVVDTDPVRLAKKYGAGCADALIVFGLYKSTQVFPKITESKLNATALLIIVPKLPGS